MIRPRIDEHSIVLDYIGVALSDSAAPDGRLPTPPNLADLSAIHASVCSAYERWWLSLPWWRALWLAGSAERRLRRFTDHARQSGLLDRWAKRLQLGLRAVGP